MTRQCPQCRHDNPQWAQFCAQCGMKIDLPRPPVVPATPPRQTACPTRRAPCRSSAGRRLMLLAIILLAGAGWFVVMLPPNHHNAGPRFRHLDHLLEPTPAPVGQNTNIRVTDHKLFHEDHDVADAMFRLLSPSHVPILVQRIDGERFTARGTPEQIHAVSRFLDLLRTKRHHAFKVHFADYSLPIDQAKALEKALESSEAHITVRRNGSTLHVLAGDALHGALDNFLQYVRPDIESMVDISNRRDY